jgi:ubiquinone/menaquinone biosynthesis C-methylase UbiE
MKDEVILILYTTLYRTGGPKFVLASKHLAMLKASEFKNHEIICKAIESKKEFLHEISLVEAANKKIKEFHFVGHSGLYGIMFGTTKWPEQFSPYEWKQMKVPFADSARFYFHSCRSGRWFAPFIARTFGVRAYGHFWYTTISNSADKFSWEGIQHTSELYVISCPGRKSHGLLGSLYKYSGIAKAIPMLEFTPDQKNVDSSYDSVAKLYDDTFADIRVRSDEWRWVLKNLNPIVGKTILDIGCGNGAWLYQWANQLNEGVGVDASEGMLEQARKRCENFKNLSFKQISGPNLPFEDNKFDAVVSILSFRYLDWDPMMCEILRVLKPGGEIFIVDMAAAPVKWKEYPQFIIDKLMYLWQNFSQKNYIQNLKKMVTNRGWKKMLEYNPIRSEHELTWYLESRFPGNKVNIINVGWKSRILAFRTGPVHVKTIEKMVYP